MLVANLRDPAPPRGSAVSKTLARTQAGPPGPVLSEQARLRSEKPPEPGTPPSPLSQRLQSPELCFLYSHRSDPPNLGVGAAPLIGPGEEGAVAWVLPASNRFMRDLLPFSQAAAKAGRPWKPAAAANGDANRYPHFPPLFLSSKTKPPRDPIWPKSQSFVVVEPSPQAQSRRRVRDQPFASANRDGSCLLGLLNVRNQTTLIVYCCKRTTLVCNGKSGWQLLTSAPVKG